MFYALMNVSSVPGALLTKRTRPEGGPVGGRRPGVVLVMTSSLKCNSLDYCNTRHVSAPNVSHVTGRKVHFARKFYATTASAPDHCSIVAKLCP